MTRYHKDDAKTSAVSADEVQRAEAHLLHPDTYPSLPLPPTPMPSPSPNSNPNPNPYAYPYPYPNQAYLLFYCRTGSAEHAQL